MNVIKLKYSDSSFLEQVDIERTANEASGYVKHMQEVARSGNYDSVESSINLPFDSGLKSKIEGLVLKKKIGNLKYIIVVGIGGSNLGTKAIYEAVRGTNVASWPRLIFADTVSSKLFSDINTLLADAKSEEEFIINAVSKSGTTTETIAQLETIVMALKERFPRIIDRIVLTTDYKSKLWVAAEVQKFDLIEIPANVGGRYSVFSAVGLFPLALAGLNIGQLLEGARLTRDNCISLKTEENIALASASIIHLHAMQNIRINNNFFFVPELEGIGRWYRQLMGESIGKEMDANGNKVNAGITPTISIGSTDLHSMAQLYLGGPRDKFTNFVSVENDRGDAQVPNDLLFPGLVEGIKGKKFTQIMHAIYGGVRTAYINNQIPFMEVKMPNVSEYTVGAYLQFKMMEMMYLAKFMNLNAFDQPNVEEYKEETRKLLGS
jgi:glucose-6-phosphate isomerase